MNKRVVEGNDGRDERKNNIKVNENTLDQINYKISGWESDMV